jgi:hypothetical protein
MSTDSDSPINPSRPRCTVYIDGFNLYYGICADRPDWKWLNFQAFFEMLRPREDVVSIKYFTAIVDRKKTESVRRDRQLLYLKALSTLSKVEVVRGVFQPRDALCEATCREQYSVSKEKKTDVNIAIRMMQDCLDNATDSIVLVSGDSDQEPAIHWIQKRYPQIALTVYLPMLPEDRRSRRNDFYASIGVQCVPLPLDGIPAHQFHRTVKLYENGALKEAVQRPAEWALQPVS